jgi:hypothetical protein
VSYDVCPANDNPASCKIHAVICFLFAKNMSVPEIQRELFMVYSRNVMSERTVRQCSKMGEMFMMNSEVIGHL